MGEMAEAILNGEFCQYCGCIMDDQIPPDWWFKKQAKAKKQGKELVWECDSPGYPRSCDSCNED